MAAAVEQSSICSSGGYTGGEQRAVGIELAGARHRLSMSPSHSKGLLNAPGQNNCFLNSAVQVLWHLDVFRRSFRHLTGHACMASACIFCSLKGIFKQFQSSDKSALPPDGLRRALARTFADQQRFQLGIMDDAAECFENILLRLHTHVAPQESIDDCRAAHCIPHRKFTMAIVEKVQCANCGATSEPFAYDEMVYYLSTTALVAEATAEYAANGSCGNFARLLRQTVCKGDLRQCPGGCGASCEKQRFLQNSPDVVSIGLVWESDKVHTHHIQDTMFCVGTSLKLDELFHEATASGGRVQGHAPVSKELTLVGVVCYYGMHYSTYFFHSKIKEWIYFDDAIVHQVSSSWDAVVERICRGRHQPLLLLYMNADSRPISGSSAPRTVTMVDGYKLSDGTMSASNAVSLDARRLQSPVAGEKVDQELACDEGRPSLSSNVAYGRTSAAHGRSSAEPSSRIGGNSCRRSASVSSSNASFVLDDALLEYDTQSSVMSCESASLVGLECAPLGCPGSEHLEGVPRSGSVCRSGGRSSVPPSRTSPNLSPSSSLSGFGMRRPASALSDGGRLDPPASFANVVRGRQSPTLAGMANEPVLADPAVSLPGTVPSLSATGMQPSASSLSLSPRKRVSPTGLASKRQVGELASNSPITVSHSEAADALWPSPPPPLILVQQPQTSPVYIKPPLLYGAATLAANVVSVTNGQEGKTNGSSDSDVSYIDSKKVEAVLSQRLKLSRMHSLGIGDVAADRSRRCSTGEAQSCSSRNDPAVSTKLLRPSRDLPMASSALAAAAGAVTATVQPQLRHSSDGSLMLASAADSTSLASSTNDSGYRSAGSTSSNCSNGGAGGSAGSLHSCMRSPSSLSLPESPSTAASDSQFDFASHNGTGSAAKAEWSTARIPVATHPWEQLPTRRTFRPVPQPPRATDDEPREPPRRAANDGTSYPPSATSLEAKVDLPISVVPHAESALGAREAEWLPKRPTDFGCAATAAGSAERSSQATPHYLPSSSADVTTSTADSSRSAVADQKTADRLAGSQACDALCSQADDLLAKAQELIESGNNDDNSLATALSHYHRATEALKKAMLMDAYDNATAVLYAQRKHDVCVTQTEAIRRRMVGLQNRPGSRAASAMEHTPVTVANLACPTGQLLSDAVSILPSEESPVLAKTMTRRSSATSMTNGTAASTPSRFGYTSQPSLPAPRSVTSSQVNRASLDTAAPKVAAVQQHAVGAGVSSSRAIGMSGHPAGATAVEGSRLRQPSAATAGTAAPATAQSTIGSSSILPGSRRLVSPRTTTTGLAHTSAGAPTPASADSTPSTTPRLDGNRQPAVGGYHQPSSQLPLTSSRCGSACSSVSSSSVGSSSRDLGLLPRPHRVADGPTSTAGGSRLHRWSGASSGSSPAADANGQPSRLSSLASSNYVPRARQPSTAMAGTAGPMAGTAGPTAAAGRQSYVLPPASQAGPSLLPPSSQLTRRDIRELLVADMNKRISECPSPRGGGSTAAASTSSSAAALGAASRRQTVSAAVPAAATAVPAAATAASSPLQRDVTVAGSERSTPSRVADFRGMMSSGGGPSAVQGLSHGSGAEAPVAAATVPTTTGVPRSLIPAPSSALSRARLTSVARSGDDADQQQQTQLPPTSHLRPAATSSSRHGTSLSKGLGSLTSQSLVRHSAAR